MAEITQQQQALMDGQVGFDETSELDDMEAIVTEDENGETSVEFRDPADIEDDIDAMIDETVDHEANLAEYMSDEDLNLIAQDVLDKIEQDEESRSEWGEILRDGISLLGLKIEEKSQPWIGACSATHPVLIESITKFQAKAFSELFPSRGPVKTKIIGNSTKPRKDQAIRVKDFMNYEVQHMMPEYGPEVDQMLFHLALEGSAFKKTYYDPVLGRPCSRFVKSQDFIAPYFATDLETCERFGHKMELTYGELRKYQVSGLWRDIDLGEGVKTTPDEPQQEHDMAEGKSPSNEDETYEIYEEYIDYNLPGFEHKIEDEETERPLPYIITIDKNSQKVLSIRRNWKQGDPNYEKRLRFTHYKFVPGLGFYGYGYLHMIGGLAKAATASMQQLIDSGTLANLPAGFKAHGLRVVGDQDPFQPGEFKDVNAPMGDLTKAIVPLPFKEPSATLFNLLQFVVTAAERFADSTEQVVSEAQTYGPVGTIMALLEQSGKLFSAIHKRLHIAQQKDFKILAELNFEWMPDQYPYEVHEAAKVALKADFDGRVDVIPVSDPNMPTQSHRIAKANAIFSVAAQSPQEHNMREVLNNIYESMDIENHERFLKPLPPQAQPLDPVTENVIALDNKPLKAGMEQNHEAHIRAHYAFMQLPSLKMNPVALPALVAHIQEHVGMDYRMRIQSILGVQLPPPGTPLPPELEMQIAEAAATATEQMLESEIMKEALSDPSIMVALKGLEIEQEKNYQKFFVDLEKIAQDDRKLKVDDENEDMDRIKDLQVARINQQGRKSNASK